jgi:hypothetical protein
MNGYASSKIKLRRIDHGSAAGTLGPDYEVPVRVVRAQEGKSVKRLWLAAPFMGLLVVACGTSGSSQASGGYTPPSSQGAGAVPGAGSTSPTFKVGDCVDIKPNVMTVVPCVDNYTKIYGIVDPAPPVGQEHDACMKIPAWVAAADASGGGGETTDWGDKMLCMVVKL